MRSLCKALSLGFFLVPFVTAFQYNIDVGKNDTTGQKGIGFDPSEIFPSVGDVVNFVFQSGTHSVDQSSFEHPCTPNGGFDSGPNTVSSGTALDAPGLPVVEVYINDTSSRWYFDGSSGACQQGAVFAINPTSEQNFTAFLANAATDTPPATFTESSVSSTGTASSTVANPSKTNAAAKHNFAAGNAALLLLTSIIGMM